ncbi:MAG: YraN family protein [Proteobacteria bacterium]|nr:YraN family protein [Pseudomonadota bacterium]MCL2309892.1 YraN family protein [Pseudomonadota bacterium]
MSGRTRNEGTRTRALADQKRGQDAETLAATFLAQQGLVVVARNVRNRYGEIDIIARDGDALVFVEVRLRGSSAFGGAAASISTQKQQRLWRAAERYLAELGQEPPCRFDAVLLETLDGERLHWQRDILHASH